MINPEPSLPDNRPDLQSSPSPLRGGIKGGGPTGKSTSHPISPQADRDTLGLAATRFLITFLLGPLLGTLVFVIAILASEISDGHSLMQFITQDLLGLLGLGYVFGLVPAFGGAVLMALFALRFRQPRAQLIAAIPLGAIAGLVGMTSIMFGFDALTYFDWQFHMTSALAGATALLGSTLVFLRRIRPRLVA